MVHKIRWSIVTICFHALIAEASHLAHRTNTSTHPAPSRYAHYSGTSTAVVPTFYEEPPAVHFQQQCRSHQTAVSIPHSRLQCCCRIFVCVCTKMPCCKQKVATVHSSIHSSSHRSTSTGTRCVDRTVLYSIKVEGWFRLVEVSPPKLYTPSFFTYGTPDAIETLKTLSPEQKSPITHHTRI